METLQKFVNTKDYVGFENYIKTLDKTSEFYYYAYGIYYYLKGEFIKAHDYFVICTKKNKENLEYKGKLIEVNYKLKKYDDVIKLCKEYLEKQESNMSVMFALAEVYNLKMSYRQAYEFFLKCLNANHNRLQCTEKLVHLCHNLGYTDQLHKFCKDFINLTDDIEREYIYRIVDMLTINPKMTSIEQILADRTTFANNLDKLLKMEIKISNADYLISPWSLKLGFPLSYHHINNRDILMKLSKLYRQICPEINYIAEHCKEYKKHDGKIRVGFISSFFRDHSVAKDRRGVMRLLDRNKFDVFVIFVSQTDDTIAKEIWNYGNAVLLDPSLKKGKTQIESLKLDILVFPEIGMNMSTYLYSHMRLAPIQINAWGHSDTSGVDTVDYYMSSKLYEVDDYEIAKTHYSEKLICLDSLCTYYVNPVKFLKEHPKQNPNITSVLANKNIYVCCGSLIKFHPIMDDIFTKILDKDKNAIILMINDGINREHVENRLKLKLNSKDDISRTAFIMASYDPDFFTSILLSGKVILDTYPFGGCNSSLEAFAIGKPVVTLPGEFINGRFTYGFYKKMGIYNLIAKDIDDYVDIAYKLANDEEYNSNISKEILEKSPCLFEDMDSVYEWNSKLEELYISL